MSRERLANALAGLVVLAALLTFPVRGALAAEQTLKLRNGWNLVSLHIQPGNASPAVVFADAILAGLLQAVWSYDAGTETWSRFPTVSDQPALDAIESGRGYWVRVTGDVTLTVAGPDDVIPQGPGDLVAGWNLVGFVSATSQPYDRVFHDVPVRQIWGFDASARRFRGVVLGADDSAAPLLEEFSTIEPGKAYWVQAGEPASLLPQLATALPGDVDVAPLLAAAPAGTRPPFDMMAMSPGDRDIGNDGFYDRSESQRSVDLGDFTTLTKLAIFNRGNGTLAWRASVVDGDCGPWLRFRVAGETPADDQFLAVLSGAVATDTAEIDLYADRTGLPAGECTAQVRIDSNGADAAYPAERSRLINVRMQVPPLDGDYRVTATIATINGQPADTHNPRYFLSLYRDSDGLKGIFDGSRSLLIPEYCVGGLHRGLSCGTDDDCGAGGRCEHYARAAGQVYESNTNRFTVTGSFELPVGADDNPYQAPLRRDITLLGDRPSRGDATLGPEDLKGEYRETIRNVLSLPIYLEGTFVAERVNPAPSARDVAMPEDGQAFDVADDATELVRTLNVTEQLLLSEVDVHVNLIHNRPSDLVLTLTGPGGVPQVVLRNHSAAPAGDLVYDDTATPQDDMSAFVGKLSAGTWTLRIRDDVPGERGSLINWDLRLHGTRINAISGRVSNVGAGAVVLLSGCGVVRSTTTDVTGAYRFDDLIDCLYAVSVQKSGFTSPQLPVTLQGSDVTDADLSPGTAPADTPIVVTLPSDGAVKIVSLTIGAGAGAIQPNGELQYAMDAANYDIDRPPTSPNNPGPEDSNGFLSGRNPVTGSNLVGQNGQIDGPADPAAARRAYVAMALPVVGRSVADDTRIAIGANP